MITEAIISGATESAIFKRDGGYFFLERSEGDQYRYTTISQFDINRFSIANSEIIHHRNIRWSFERLSSELQTNIENHTALNLFLMGMDSSLSDDLRRDVMRLLWESMSSKSTVENFVLKRVFSTIIPEEFDALSAYEIAEDIGNNVVSKWYKDLASADQIIIAVRDAWRKLLLQEKKLLDIELLDKEFTDRGVFFDLVFALLSYDDHAIDSSIITHSAELKRLNIGQPAVFLTTLKQMVYDTLSVSQVGTNKASLEDLIRHDQEYVITSEDNFALKFNRLINNFKGKKQRVKESKKGYKTKGRPLANFFKETDISKQILWIKDKIHERNIGAAEDAILRLVDYQDLHSNADDLCKSLSDIAKEFQKVNLIDRSDLIVARAIDLDPNDPIPYTIQAENFRVKGHLESALKTYENAIRCFPKDVFLRAGKAETLRQMGRLDEALSTYNDTIEKFDGEVVPRAGKAETLRQMGRLDEALSTYNDTIEKFDGEVVPRAGKAETLRQMGRLGEALSTYNDTIERFDGEVVPRSGKAETLRQMGRLDEALAAYNETIWYFKNEVVPRSGKAETLRQMGRLDEALTAYNQTIHDFKYDVVSRNGKAETLRQMGRLDEAEIIYNRIIVDFPYNQVARTARYVLLIQKGMDLDELEKEIQVSNKQPSKNWILNHVHSMLLIKLDRIDEAIDKLNYGIESIQDVKYINYYKNLLAYAYIQKRRFKDVMENFSKEVNPSIVLKVLATHAYAADSNMIESKENFKLIFQSPIKKVDEVSKKLSDRYHLTTERFFTGKSKEELDQEIDDLEFDLLTEPFRVAA